MQHEYIQFKKQRELGEILSITFKFLRENYKSMGKILLKIAGPAFVLLIAAVGYYSWSTAGMSIFTTATGGSDLLLSLGLMLLAYLLYVTSMTGTIYHSILSYIHNNGTIVSTEVAAGMKEDFGRLLVITLISWVLIFTGTLLFIIPGIYLAIPLSFASTILVFERKGTMDSISDCFQLVKDNWWMTFASILCIGLIIYLVGLVFQMPAIIYFMVKAITVVEKGSAADPSEMFGTGYIVISVITSMIQYTVYCITPIGVAFIYFNLNEKKNFTGTYETIQNLGNNN